MSIASKVKSANIQLYPKHLFYAPNWIVLGVNNVCNLHCKMCDVGTQNLDSTFAQNLVGTQPLNMPEELTKKIIDDTARFFPTSKVAYAFTEPLVYPHLISTLEYANERGVYTTLTTNALTLPHKAERLVNAGLNQINVSLDGPESTHNEIRGHKKSFQKAIEGIEKLKSLDNHPEITVICAITEWNHDQLYEFARFFESIGIDTLAFMHTQYTTQDLADEHNEIWGQIYPATDSNVDLIDHSNIDLQVLAEQIRKVKEARFSFSTYFSPDIDGEKLLYTYYMQPEIFMGKRCHEIFQSIMIKSDGSVIPAHGRCFNLSLGNMNDQNLKQVWNSGIASKFRADVSKAGGLLPACSRCCSGFGE
ncbi:MAG: radical SAM protein [Roseivirga sp.]|nr:radical SAM protein [Roseivirga sp.]